MTNIVKSFLILITGLLLMLPFIISVMSAHAIASEFLLIIGIVLGGSLFMSGVILLFIPDNCINYANDNSLIQQDIARIRYSIELKSRKK